MIDLIGYILVGIIFGYALGQYVADKDNELVDEGRTLILND